jgi:hypothetical protein
VGVCDGANDGLSVVGGLVVGLSVGLPVGMGVGTAVGLPVVMGVGLSVGVPDGANDGRSVVGGLLDGLSVGGLVGTVVGVPLEVPSGLGVGCFVGLPEGFGVGTAVGGVGGVGSVVGVSDGTDEGVLVLGGTFAVGAPVRGVGGVVPAEGPNSKTSSTASQLARPTESNQSKPKSPTRPAPYRNIATATYTEPDVYEYLQTRSNPHRLGRRPVLQRSVESLNCVIPPFVSLLKRAVCTMHSKAWRIDCVGYPIQRKRVGEWPGHLNYGPPRRTLCRICSC